jgi:RHS repeat-associated protein
LLDYQYKYYADGSVKSIDGITEPEITRGRTEYVTLNDNNRLDYVTRPDSSVRSYVQDNSGKITSDGLYTYSYNPLGRLIKVEQGATTVAEYAYDPFGRRTKKTVSGTTTHFHYDLQGRLIAETAGDGTPLRNYIYQNGNLVAIKLHGTQAGVYYVISDHLGTPQQIVDATGTVVWKAAFLPFGKAQILTETITNNIRFPGQYFDAETGLHYNWNRYYDPDTGRYLTPDPIGLAGGLNLYAYVAGDPVNGIDPWGLSEADVRKIISAGNRSIEEMNRKNQRLGNYGRTGNAASILILIPADFWTGGLFDITPYLSCGEQADKTLDDLKRLQKDNEFDDDWNFYRAYGAWGDEEPNGDTLIFPHVYGIGKSSNPNDPNILIDPWKGTIKPIKGDINK